MEGAFSVHPFDDEWVWDSKRSGSHPWVTETLEDAIAHANLVRLEYASVVGVDPSFIAGFWSSIYDELEDPGQMIGWVNPDGNYAEGSRPPLDEQGGWAGLQPGDWVK